jgi:hypothetical protein
VFSFSASLTTAKRQLLSVFNLIEEVHSGGDELKRAKEKLERVIEYALTGDKCRYSMLAKYVTFEDAR